MRERHGAFMMNKGVAMIIHSQHRMPVVVIEDITRVIPPIFYNCYYRSTLRESVSLATYSHHHVVPWHFHRLFVEKWCKDLVFRFVRLLLRDGDGVVRDYSWLIPRRERLSNYTGIGRDLKQLNRIFYNFSLLNMRLFLVSTLGLFPLPLFFLFRWFCRRRLSNFIH